MFLRLNSFLRGVDVSLAPAGADTTTVTVTEYVMPAPVIESNCVSEFQDVGCGLPQQQVACILVPPTMEEIAEVVQITPQEPFQQSIEDQIFDASCAVAPSPAREGRWKFHLSELVPVIEHVTPAPDAVHAATAPVVALISSLPHLPLPMQRLPVTTTSMRSSRA